LVPSSPLSTRFQLKSLRTKEVLQDDETQKTLENEFLPEYLELLNNNEALKDFTTKFFENPTMSNAEVKKLIISITNENKV
jgi:hypothetical protein